MSMTFDRTRPCLVVAPHLEYPTRNGGDILIDRRWAGFSIHVPYVDIVGKRTVTRYRGGSLDGRTDFDNEWGSKRRAAATAVLKRSHYLLEKYLTPGFRAEARKRLLDGAYSTVVFSLISTASLRASVPEFPGRLYCVETQNDELKWFSDLKGASGNPLARLAAHFSGRWLESFLKTHEDAFLYIHVSGADRDGYGRIIPGHKSIVAPVGVDMDGGVMPCRDDAGKVRLIFAGSLGVKMNLDALNVFRKEFYPPLKAALGTGLAVLVVGSRPSAAVVSLCAEHGWELHPDVSDEEMARLYASSAFSILPFHYVTGGKLKLLKTLASGVPFLSTIEMRDQVDELVYPCHFSNDPGEWVKRVLEIKERGISPEAREALVGYARRYSWPVIVSGLISRLENLSGRKGVVTT
ncbi:MAG: glycosyltransferase [Deltaproteobacteria bacterium]|nr:glycosyltransferase [Deltaproteobacteria bacterium]